VLAFEWLWLPGRVVHTGAGRRQSSGEVRRFWSLTCLGEGYATFENTLQHPANNCNAVLQAETAMMSKEHFIKIHGVPRYTVSAGCSGGLLHESANRR